MRPALAPYLSCKICVFATHLKLSLITLSVARLRAVLYLLHLLHLLCAFEALPKKVTETQGMGTVVRRNAPNGRAFAFPIS